MGASSEQLENSSPNKPQLIRCGSCRAAINEGLERCPYCGQRTTGNEQRITTLDITMQMRARAAERRKVGQCAICGTRIVGEQKICAKCEKKDSKKNIVLVIFASLAIFLLLWFFT